MSATRDQAEHLRRQQAADHREPGWKRRPRTATERQAAGLLAEPADEEDGDAAADEHDAVTHPANDPEAGPSPSSGSTATERQVAAILGTGRS